MADPQAIRALVEKAYAARDSGDIDNAVAKFHPEGSFSVVGNAQALSLVGTARGHAEIRQSMGGFIESFEFVNREILQFIAEGDHAAVRSRLKVRFIPKDKTFSTEVLDVFEIKDGEIVSFMEYADTALIRDIVSL